MMECCPKCGKRLLSHASSRCNWCGAVIEDPTYQAEAQRRHDDFVVQDEARMALDQARTNMMRWQNWNSIVGFGGWVSPPRFCLPRISRPIPPYPANPDIELYGGPSQPPPPTGSVAGEQVSPVAAGVNPSSSSPQGHPFASGLGQQAAPQGNPFVGQPSQPREVPDEPPECAEPEIPARFDHLDLGGSGGSQIR